MQQKDISKFTRSVFSSAVLMVFANTAFAAAFENDLHAASATGNANAGAAASGNDASTVFFNPAAMVILSAEHSFTASIAGVAVDTDFTDRGTTSIPAFTSPRNTSSTHKAFIPSLYYATKVTPDFSLGFALTPSFTTLTDYDDQFIGRFWQDRSEIKVINSSVAFGARLSPKWSIGGGIDIAKINAKLTMFIPLGIPPAPEVLSTVEGSDTGWGANFGVLFQPSESTNVGLHYRSRIDFDVSGESRFNPNVPPLLSNQPANAAFTSPELITLSVAQKLNNKWRSYGSFQYKGWHTVKTLNVQNNAGVLLGSTTYNLVDTYSLAIGADYYYNDKLTLKYGVAYDKTAVPDDARSIGLPDENRLWLALGGKYAFTPRLSLDAAYAYVRVGDASINQPYTRAPALAPALGNLVGTAESKANILSVQLNYQY